MKLAFFYLLWCSQALVYAQINPIVKPFLLGNDKVNVLIYEKDYTLGNLLFVHVHENETASVSAGIQYIKKNGGKLVTLQHSFDGSVNRLVKFTYKSKEYEFDPNRIFSKDINVLRKTLKSNEKNADNYKEALELVNSFANFIWTELKESNFIVSLHNNKNECASCVRKGWFGRKLIDESYNITSYVQKCDVKSESNQSCEDIYINPSINNSEFFIVTQRRDFDYFLSKRYNVVLQNQHPVDDGSMSVFAVLNKVRYINAEAKHGRVSEQAAMLELVKGMQ
jgi:hypothetical protein